MRPPGGPELGAVAQLLAALADPTRLAIVAWLAHGELCVCHLQEGLGAPQPTVSRHLSVLRAAGVVETRRQHKWVFYRLARQADSLRAASLRVLVRRLRADRALRRQVHALTRSRGPGCADGP